jgi:hypothetical protein
MMTIKLVQKDTGKPLHCLATQLVLWNEDEDGVGSMVHFASGIFREVRETPAEITCAVQKALRCYGGEK